tara:strand:- start:71 stop:310 length:240 start_codon:yes stop_codon:yes gene_type:complete
MVFYYLNIVRGVFALGTPFSKTLHFPLPHTAPHGHIRLSLRQRCAGLVVLDVEGLQALGFPQGLQHTLQIQPYPLLHFL